MGLQEHGINGKEGKRCGYKSVVYMEWKVTDGVTRAWYKWNGS